jgi:hypothetical protein
MTNARTISPWGRLDRSNLNQIWVAEISLAALHFRRLPPKGAAAKVSMCHLYSEELTMEWTTPRHEEICLSCEVSSYANAEL